MLQIIRTNNSIKNVKPKRLGCLVWFKSVRMIVFVASFREIATLMSRIAGSKTESSHSLHRPDMTFDERLFFLTQLVFIVKLLVNFLY